MKLLKKKVLVTGSEGFIGSHLVERLVKEGCVVRAFVLYNSFNSIGWLDTLPEDVLKKVEIFVGDIRDPGSAREAVKGIDVVFHLAALIGIPYSYHAPQSYIETNIFGTYNVVQASREAGVSKVIHTSTSEVYGSAIYVPIDEKHPFQPQSPYSASKIGADAIAESYFRSFDLPVAIARPFNTYGPRQSARAVIPTIITQLALGRKSIRLGDVTPTRDFNYVKDTCRGLIALASSDKTIGETVNIGSNSEISVGDLFDLICRMMGSKARMEVESRRIRPVKSEVRRLYCDNSKLKKLTGFVSEYSLEKGLCETIAWFTKPSNLSKYKGDAYNV